MLIRESLSLRLVLTLLLATSRGITFAQSLRDDADHRKILVGAAVNPALFAEAPYASTLMREFNMVEPENVMKWGAVRPAQDKFNFGPGDEVVAFAQSHEMKVRGHCLLWSEHNPAWLSKGSFTPEQLSNLLREHITTVMKHYSGRVFAWDVVNEAFLANGAIEPFIWYDSPGIGFAGKGTAYIEQALRWARAADPKALLFYNDYDTEGLNAKSDAVYTMAKDFKKRGVPIDGVGIQAHIFNFDMKEISSLAANLARLTALSVQVHITEMDIALPLDARVRYWTRRPWPGKRTSIDSLQRPVCNSRAAPLSRRGGSRTSTVGFRVTQKGRKEGHCFSIRFTRRNRLTTLCAKCWNGSVKTQAPVHES